jgi:hypothetical protein
MKRATIVSTALCAAVVLAAAIFVPKNFANPPANEKPSLKSMLSQAKYVFAGKVLDARSVEMESYPVQVRYTVKFKITERFKGECDKNEIVILYTFPRRKGDVPFRWLKGETAVVCLKDGKLPETFQPISAYFGKIPASEKTLKEINSILGDEPVQQPASGDVCVTLRMPEPVVEVGNCAALDVRIENASKKMLNLNGRLLWGLGLRIEITGPGGDKYLIRYPKYKLKPLGKGLALTPGMYFGRTTDTATVFKFSTPGLHKVRVTYQNKTNKDAAGLALWTGKAESNEVKILVVDWEKSPEKVLQHFAGKFRDSVGPKTSEHPVMVKSDYVNPKDKEDMLIKVGGVGGEGVALFSRKYGVFWIGVPATHKERAVWYGPFKTSAIVK